MKEILYGSNDKEPHTETVAQLAQELYNSGLLIALVENLQVIDFEVLKERLFLFMLSVRTICYRKGMPLKDKGMIKLQPRCDGKVFFCMQKAGKTGLLALK